MAADLLIEFFHGYVQLDAHKNWKHRLQGRREKRRESGVCASGPKKDIEVNVLASIKSEEEKKMPDDETLSPRRGF
jgi:hypothetical protein